MILLLKIKFLKIMQCSTCYFNTDQKSCCSYGQCKECYQNIPLQNAMYCLPCSEKFKECYQCGISMNNNNNYYIDKYNMTCQEEHRHVFVHKKSQANMVQ